MMRMVIDEALDLALPMTWGATTGVGLAALGVGWWSTVAVLLVVSAAWAAVRAWSRVVR